ncbi:MAG: tetratricopeptide repeat protein [Acidobacteriota bacterium]
MRQCSLFISCSSSDQPAARRVAQVIAGLGFTSKASADDVYADHSWPSLIGQEIVDRDALLLLWSKDAASSRTVQFEWSAALALKKPVIPCLLDDTPLDPALMDLSRIGIDELQDSLPSIFSGIAGQGSNQAANDATRLLENLRRIPPAAPEEMATVATLILSSASGTQAPAGRGSGTEEGPSDSSSAQTQFAMPTGSVILGEGMQVGSRYTIKKMLGQGGMGTVYLAYDSELDRDVALKVIRREIADHPEILERFKREIQLSSVVTHKNVLRVYDLGESDGFRFLTMQYVEGENLSALLRREKRLPEERVVGIFRQICKALQAAHEQGVLHRDLKPDNVMLDRKDQVFLTDFGLAKSIQQSALTQVGQIMGTPDYMSPEQVKGESVDERSDLYTLGAILYQLVAGQVPFQGNSVFEVMMQRVQKAPRPVTEFNPEAPPFLSQIIERCMAIDPDARYPSVAAILEDLEQGITTGHTRFATRFQLARVRGTTRKWVVRGAVLAAGSALLGLAVLVFFFGLRLPSDGAGDAVLPNRKYVAILPFRVLGDPGRLGYLATGLSEALSARLFQLRELQVASSTAVEEVDANTPLQEVARRLGVSLILHGTLQGAGDRIAVTVKLEDMESGKSLWAKSYSGMVQDLLTLQDQIYDELLSVLEVTPSLSERARVITHSTENSEAYDLYLRGRNALRGRQDVKNVQTALNLFQEALQKDSSFALAYVGVADASLAMFDETRSGSWTQRAVAAGEQARSLNPNLPEVFFALGSVYRITGKEAEAVSVLKQAIELAPNSDEGYRRLGSTLASAGRNREAIEAYRKAVELNPYYWLNFSSLGGAYYQIGEYDQALEAYRKVVELEPDNAWGHLNIGAMLLGQGKYEESIPAFQRALEIKASWDAYSNLGTAYFFLHRYPEAVTAFEKAVELGPNRQMLVGNLADAYRWSGQTEKARQAYDRAIELAFGELKINPRNADALASLALYYAKKGDTAEARNFVRRARALDPGNVEYAYHEAVVKTLAGDVEGALTALKEALSKGYPLQAVEDDPELDALRKQPGYQTMVKGSRPTAAP